MCGRAFWKSAQLCVVFYLVTFCANSTKGNFRTPSHRHHHKPSAGKHKSSREGENHILKTWYKPKHRTGKVYLNKNSSTKSSKQDFFLDRRDFVPKKYINTPISKKQYIFEQFYGNGRQDFSHFEDENKAEMTSSMEGNKINDYTVNIQDGGNHASYNTKARKLTPSDLEYGELKKVEDADKSVNEVINSLIDDDKNLEKSMADSTLVDDNRPTPSQSEGSEDFDVTINDGTGTSSTGKTYALTAKETPEVVSGALLDGMPQAVGNYQPLDNSGGKNNAERIAHSWSVQMDSSSGNDYDGSNQNSRHGNISGSYSISEDTKPLNETRGSYTNKQGTIDEGNDENGYIEFENAFADQPITNKPNNSISFVDENEEGINSNDNSSSQVSDGNNLDDKINVSSNTSPPDNNSSHQSFSNETNMVVEKVAGDINSSTNETNSFQSESSAKNVTDSEQIVVGGGAKENTRTENASDVQSLNVKNESTSVNTSVIQEDDYHGNATKIDITANTNNLSSSDKNSNGTNLEIYSKDDNNSTSVSNTTAVNKVYAANIDNSTADERPSDGATTPSNFLKQHPNAFRVLMEYFRKEALLQEKLRSRLNALRKTNIDQNARKKSFASVHELEAMPKGPLPLREFVADLFKLATENESQKTKTLNFLEAEAKPKQHRKPARKVSKPIVGAPRISSGRENAIQPSKHPLLSRKADVSFLANFENVTEVAKEINGNISKIFQDAMNSNSNQATDKVNYAMNEPSSSNSAIDTAEKKIDKIISQNEISLNDLSFAGSNVFPKERTVSGEGNAILSATIPSKSHGIVYAETGPVESNAISNAVTGTAGESNAISNAANGPTGSNAISNAANGPTGSNAISNAAKGPTVSNPILNSVTGPVESNTISNAANGPTGSNAILNSVTGPVESNAISNAAKGPTGSNAISSSVTEPIESNAISAGIISKENNASSIKMSYGVGQAKPFVSLNDDAHTKTIYMDSKTLMYKKELKSLEVSLSQDFFNFWMYHYRSFDEMSIKPEQLRSGIANLGSTDRLARVIKKALRGEAVNLLIVGGSISAGGGLEKDRQDLHGIYYKAFVEWWKNTVVPITTSDLKLNVVSIGGTDSEYFSYCIKNYIRELPDLVIWELAANDYRRYIGREMDPAKPLEQLTRVLLTLPSQPALIFINFFRGDYYKTTVGQDCPDSEDEGGRIIAEYYKITSLTWRNIICSQMKPDILSTTGASKREYTPLTIKTLFSSDGYHPSLLGHAQCATLLISYVRSVFEEVVSRELSRLDEGGINDDDGIPKSELPRPIFDDPVAPHPMCWTLLTPNFHEHIANQLPNMRIVEANGFEFTNITHWLVRMDRLRCLKAQHAGASLRISFDVPQRENENPSAQRDIAIISHNSFSGSARVWLDDDQDNALIIKEPSGQRRTQANILKRVLSPGSHGITIRSITPGFCVSALAVL